MATFLEGEAMEKVVSTLPCGRAQVIADDAGPHGADEEAMEWNDADGVGGHDGAAVMIP